LISKRTAGDELDAAALSSLSAPRATILRVALVVDHPLHALKPPQLGGLFHFANVGYWQILLQKSVERGLDA
jgi:hypothetical protein